jgi:hypothetical protein
MDLIPPHIPLGINLEEAIEILAGVSSDIEKYEQEKEDFYKVASGEWECGFYTKGGVVHSTWYNDPYGRGDEMGLNRKVTLYLLRYGDINDWEEGLNNGWIQYFSNEVSGVNLAYGLHRDVLRFNQIA